MQQIATAEEVSIEWIQHKILSTYSKVQIELYDFRVDYVSERIKMKRDIFLNTWQRDVFTGKQFLISKQNLSDCNNAKGS